MAVVHVTYYTDPACPWSWAAEPALRRLQVEFAEDASITYVMGGLAREFRRPHETLRHVLDASAASGMPVDGDASGEGGTACEEDENAERERDDG